MNKKALINKTVETVAKLPHDKIKEVNDFADYLLNKIEEEVLQKGIQQIVSNTKSFEFLKEEEELYTTEDLKEKY